MEKTKDLFYSINSSEPKMIEQLHEWCEINSGTENLLGLEQMRQALTLAFNPIADQIKKIKFPAINTINLLGAEDSIHYGEALFISKRSELKRRILLTGHMDTVYPKDHPFQKIQSIDSKTIKGPGVADMKGGLIVLLQALTQFEQLEGSKELGWDVFINADEEIGSIASGPFLAKIASNYQAALVYEPTLTPSGTLARNRRGSGKMTLVVTGKAAHVGRNFSEGRNAICYLAEVITAIHALNQVNSEVTINVGQIAGGEALNMVPEKAVAKLDIRINKPEQEHWVKQELQRMCSKMKKRGYTLSMHGNFGRPVKRIDSATTHLFERIKALGRKLNLKIDWQDSGGCCDGNNLASHGLPVIDTLGVRGGRIHSPEEFIILDSLVEQTALSSLLLLDLARGGLEELRS